jgi:hypothetical protein
MRRASLEDLGEGGDVGRDNEPARIEMELVDGKTCCAMGVLSGSPE